MTPIESIYEIEEALSKLQPYFYSKDRVTLKRAKMKYEPLVDRFFREHGKYIKPEQRISCLDDPGYFLELMEGVKDTYRDEM